MDKPEGIKIDKELAKIASETTQGDPCTYCGGVTTRPILHYKYGPDTCTVCSEVSYVSDRMFPVVKQTETPDLKKPWTSTPRLKLSSSGTRRRSGSSTMANKRYKQKCIRCKNQWLSYVKSPVRCTRCKSHLWNTPYKRKVK